MIEPLQISHPDSVKFCDGRERFTAGDRVCVAAWRPRHRRCGDSGGCGSRLTFSDHDARPHVRNLLLELEDLLREDVDLGVLFLDFLGQRLEQRRLR